MKKFSVVLAVCSIHTAAIAQWTPTDGPYGGWVTSLVSFNGKTYASTSGKAFISSDHGRSWEIIRSLPIYNQNAFFCVDSAVVAWIEGESFYRTTDGGVSWNRTFEGLTHEVSYTYALLVRGGAIYAGTQDGVYRSTDGGIDWSLLDGGELVGAIRCLAECQGTLFAGTEHGVYSLSDSTLDWSFSTGYSDYSLSVMGSSIFAGTINGVYRSTNGGGTWQRLTVGVIDSSMTATVVQGTDIYAGTELGKIARSTDSGSTWMNVSEGLDGGWVSVFTCDDSVLLVGTSNGLYVSADQGTRWVRSDRGITATNTKCLLVTGDSLFAGTWYSGLFVLGGPSPAWSEIQSGVLANSIIYSLVSNSGTLVAGSSCGMYKSLDGGQSWRQDSSLIGQICDLAFRDSEIFAGTDWAVWYSSNGGLTWAHRYAGLVGGYVFAVAMKGSFVFAGEGGMYRSSNGGVSWVGCNNGMAPTLVNDILVDGDRIFAAGTRGAWVSTNDGDQWELLDDRLFDVPAYAFHRHDQFLFVATDSGVFYSKDGGSGWVDWSEGLSGQQVFSVAVKGDYVYAGGYGVWRRPLSDLTSAPNEGSTTPSTFALWQNYPNPFNPSTRIMFDLPEASTISLTIYDVLGRQVAELASGHREAGYHSVTWNASNQASGIYFARFTVTDAFGTMKYSKVNKLVVMK